MRKVLLASAGAIWDEKNKRIYPGMPEALEKLHKTGNHTLLVSNHARPGWLPKEMKSVQFCQTRKRQSGDVVPKLIEANKGIQLIKSEIIVLGVSDADMQMAANSETLLIRCEWADLEPGMTKYGVGWADPKTLPELIGYLEDEAPWHFESEDDFLDVYCLTAAGTIGETDQDYEKFVYQMRFCLKDGEPALKSKLALHLLSSIYKTQKFQTAKLWGYYPSSNSTNDDSDIMADFCRYSHRLFKKQMRKPLFIRHRESTKRSRSGGDRTDPASQVNTIHINPYYRGKIKGETVVIMDDFSTYGLSFGVAAAFLSKAGAKKVIAVAMGKFGNCGNRFLIEIDGDPFAPVTAFKLHKTTRLIGKTDSNVKSTVVKKFKAEL